jgi:hypothetical protein
MMKRMIGYLALLLLLGGCKKETPTAGDPSTQEKVEEKKTQEGEVKVEGENVSVKTRQGSAVITTGKGGSEGNVKTKDETATVKTDHEGEKVQVNASGQPGVIIERDKKGGRVKINVGGLKIDVPDKKEE